MRISQAVNAYVAYKQSLGMRFATEARTLKSFYRALGDVDMDHVEADRVYAYLAGNGPITRFWHRKLDALRGFYRFALTRGYATRSPLPTTVPEQPPTFVPYLQKRPSRGPRGHICGYRISCSSVSNLPIKPQRALAYGSVQSNAPQLYQAKQP